MPEREHLVAGIDAGTECIKAVVLRGEEIIGRSLLPTRGYFHHRIKETVDVALDEAGVEAGGLAAACATGFAANCVPYATMALGETTCHAVGAHHYYPHAMSVIDIGGREPKVIRVDENGRQSDSRSVRRCAAGIGTFLMFTARHLDVHPTRLQELAAAAEHPVPVGSYCSVFAGSEVLERLREGATREEVALGCMHSIAERIYEIGGFEEPLRVTGGVAEYFPGVLSALADITGMAVEAIPEPVFAGALGAALSALRACEREGEA